MHGISNSGTRPSTLQSAEEPTHRETSPFMARLKRIVNSSVIPATFYCATAVLLTAGTGAYWRNVHYCCSCTDFRWCGGGDRRDGVSAPSPSSEAARPSSPPPPYAVSYTQLSINKSQFFMN